MTTLEKGVKLTLIHANPIPVNTMVSVLHLVAIIHAGVSLDLQVNYRLYIDYSVFNLIFDHWLKYVYIFVNMNFKD